MIKVFIVDDHEIIREGLKNPQRRNRFNCGRRSNKWR